MATYPPADPAGNPDPLHRVTTVVYDGAGRVVSATDRPGTVTYTVYDARGRVTASGAGPAPASGAPPAPAPDEEPPDEPHIVGD